MKIKCYFCQQEIPDEAIAITSLLFLSICTNCPHHCATTVRENDAVMNIARIHFEYKEWRWIATYNIPGNRFYLCRMGKIEGDDTFVTTTLLRLPFLPCNITPHNIISKMPTLITFS